MDSRDGSCGEAGRQVIAKLRELVEEEALRKVSTTTMIYNFLPPYDFAHIGVLCLLDDDEGTWLKCSRKVLIG